MAARGRIMVFGVVGIALLTLSLSVPAAAQGLIERIFSGLTRPAETPRMPVNIQAFADPLTSLGHVSNPPPRAASGPARAFCVRTCDGHFFPVQAHAGLSAAESCRAFCPASRTRLYSGATIDYSAASDGSRYADLANAFVYRKQLVAGCTCNGRNAFGLAQVDVNTDPTLRPGDVVATKSGLTVFTGAKSNVAAFTPIDSYRGFGKSYRDKLSALKIMPPSPSPPQVTLPLRADSARGDDRRSAQLSR